jgi:Spy/CpxP family protein refolding chaperone
MASCHAGDCPQGAISPSEKEKHMHPGVFAWWHARNAACSQTVGCHPHGGGPGPGGWQGRHGHSFDGPGGGDEGGGFGVRRPLRFLAYKLDLDESQVAELAAVLSELKTERAQAAVDHRRTTTSLAEAVAAEAFDEAKVKAAASQRVKSDEAVQAAVVRALGRIHALLRAEQRSKLAYLLRTGALSI